MKPVKEVSLAQNYKMHSNCQIGCLDGIPNQEGGGLE